ncbi:MAG: extracellular solute-binding protein [Clostridia bacterium]|nr:extracellular solute-binding protein [Clostridia bacterium]
MKKTVLLLLLTAALLASCGGDAGADAETKTAGTVGEASGTVTEPVVTERVPAPQLPEVDYSGETFTVLYRGAGATYAVTDVIVDGAVGEAVNDAVYDRNMRLEEKFGIDLVGIEKDTPTATAKQEIMSGSCTFDVMTDSMDQLNTLAVDSYLLDWNSLEHFEPSYAWWDSNAAKELSVGGKLYMMVSDISMNASSRARFLYINKKIASNYDLEVPYDLVRDGTWTWDKLTEMITTISADLNGDGVMDGNDLFGMLTERAEYFVSGSGVLFTEKNGEDIPEISLVSDRSAAVISAVKELMDNRVNAISYDAATKDMGLGGFAHIYDLGRSLFANDHFLFVQNGANVAYQFANMESEYGILPNPKYDENQESYYHLMDQFACAWAIPTTNAAPEKTDILMNYWGYLSSNTLVDAFYETTIKYKRLNAPEDAEMLDIIRGTIRYEISMIADTGIMDVLNAAVKSGNLMSEYEKKSKSIEKRLEKLLDAYAAE